MDICQGIHKGSSDKDVSTCVEAVMFISITKSHTASI